MRSRGGKVVWVEGMAKLGVLVDVKVIGLHETLLLGLKTTLEVALKSRLCGGPYEEAVAQCEMKRGHEEAYGLHHVPAQFPESEPHGRQRLDQYESQPTVELASDQVPGFLVDYHLLSLQMF